MNVFRMLSNQWNTLPSCIWSPISAFRWSHCGPSTYYRCRWCCLSLSLNNLESIPIVVGYCWLKSSFSPFSIDGLAPWPYSFCFKCTALPFVVDQKIETVLLVLLIIISLFLVQNHFLLLKLGLDKIPFCWSDSSFVLFEIPMFPALNPNVQHPNCC